MAKSNEVVDRMWYTVHRNSHSLSFSARKCPLCDKFVAVGSHFYRAKPIAERGNAKASCLSVRLSVTLRYRDHIGWNSAKIISRLISLTIKLSADPNMTDLLQREHRQSLAGTGVG